MTRYTNPLIIIIIIPRPNSQITCKGRRRAAYF